jgi:predicted GNAT superfamily acetyltransferase
VVWTFNCGAVSAEMVAHYRVYCSISGMSEAKSNAVITIRDLETFDDLKLVEAVEREVWKLSDLDTMPLALAIATREAGGVWLGAFDGTELVGFAFGFLGIEGKRANVHSHMLAVREPYRSLDLGYKLKLAQRVRVLGMRVGNLQIAEITWTFDPLQSRNAHLNFAKLGVVSDSYKVDFYGAETSSALHRNGTDRLWVRWPIISQRVQDRLQGRDPRAGMLRTLKALSPLVSLGSDGRPHRASLADALHSQRAAIEIPSDILSIEQKDPDLAREWRLATRWGFAEAMKSGFFVAEFCRMTNHQRGVYVLEKGTLEEYIPEFAQ